VAVGDDETEEIYHLPVDLLRERSTVFHKLLSEEGEQEVVRSEVLSKTSVGTFNAFIAWIMAAEPRLDKEDTLEETVELGILADHLGVWALSNQAMDLTASQVGSNTWQWSRGALNAVYGQVAAGRPLRRLVQATILNMDEHRRIFVRDEEEEDQAWDLVFLTHAALGCDYRRATKRERIGRRGWAGRKNPCEYHEHPWTGACEADEMETHDGACAYVTDDCYPVWKVQEVDHAEPEKGVEAVTPPKEDSHILIVSTDM
jgi:hypothetical protein